MISMNELTWKIGGEAGFGIMVSGLNFARMCMRGGLHIFTANEYPSLIRGGHNTETVRASEQKVTTIKKSVDFLVALNKETIDLHKHELSEGAGILYDLELEISPKEFDRPVRLYPIPMLQLAKDNGGDVLMRNTVAIGASIAAIGFDVELFYSVITDQFKRKGDAVVEHNKITAKAGYDYIKNHFPDTFRYKLNPIPQAKQQVLLTGNEAIGLGAVAAGMKFFAAYPMTPINGLLHYMASIQEHSGFIYKQPEDEIAAINMAIGASFAGARSMVASSGGGYSLMVEATSLAGMTETPIVIVYGMRPGPATGLPTWTAQADLPFILHAGHGEFPRLVLAASDVEDAFYLTMEAFNMADIYQTPVFIVTDKHLNESRETLDPERLIEHQKRIPLDRGKLLSLEQQLQKEEWDRYEWSEDGISSRPIPGRPKGIFRVNSDEHTPDGYSAEDAETAKKMVEKRMKKLKSATKHLISPRLYGNPSAPVTLVGWGSTKGSVLEAIRMMDSQPNASVNYIHLPMLNPFPSVDLMTLLSKSQKVIGIEGAYNAPLADYIYEKTGYLIKEKILRYDGRPFYPEDIIEEVKAYV